MNTITLILLLIAITAHTESSNKQYNLNNQNSSLKGEANVLTTDDENRDWSDLRKYIGKYSRETDFFENPVIANELLRILENDYKSYMEHVSMSGCGEISTRYGLIYGSVSQMHVGGYSSLFS